MKDYKWETLGVLLQYSITTSSGVIISDVSQRTIAQILRTSRGRVFRAITLLKADGVLSSHYTSGRKNIYEIRILGGQHGQRTKKETERTYGQGLILGGASRKGRIPVEENEE